jgi:DNA polymerase-3 subunit gamma/tau
VGQTHVERTLRNAVSDGSVAHAYLFTGPRGTGKTTTARLLAKALNCASGPTSEPDDTCEQCQMIAEGTHPDVLELDAASRTGVEAVREEIIGRVHYATTRGGWRVYIIDEVHMLSVAAFNALLKTLEEPPGHTVFILCTTHPQKVPETIHSRCQRFDFHRIGVDEIVSRLRHIADAEGVKVADGALVLIARHALGGMRDAIATLEQLSAFTGKTIGMDDVEGLLGEIGSDSLLAAAELVLHRDIAGAFRFVAELTESGTDMTEFVKGLVGHFRDLFVLAAVDADDVIDTVAEDRARLRRQAEAFKVDRIARVLDVLVRLANDLRWASDQRLAVEVALVRMARPEGDLTIEALAERVSALEAGASLRTAPLSSAAVDPAPAVASAADAPPAVERPSSPKRSAASAAATLELAAVKRAWPAVRAEFKKLRPSRSHLFDATEVELAGDALIIEFASGQEFALDLAQQPDTLEPLRMSIAGVLGADPPLEFRLGRGGGSDFIPAKSGVETSPCAEDEAEDHEEMARRVIDELGAVVLEEHPHPQKDTDAKGVS